jgi:two-component system LytT family response regulator
MVNIAICDDQKDIVEGIKGYLAEYIIISKSKCKVDCFFSGEELTRQNLKFDLIFLDVEMDGMNGIETAQLIRKKDKNVSLVYITSHSKYALETFAVHPFDFAVKPIDKNKLFDIINSFMEYRTEKSKKRILVFKVTNGNVCLDRKDIYFFEYTKSRTVTAHTKRGVIELKGSISEILSVVGSHNFVSPHKSFIINLVFVKEVKGNDVILSNGAHIPIAQRRKNSFNRDMINYYHDSLLMV